MSVTMKRSGNFARNSANSRKHLRDIVSNIVQRDSVRRPGSDQYIQELPDDVFDVLFGNSTRDKVWGSEGLEKIKDRIDDADFAGASSAQWVEENLMDKPFTQIELAEGLLWCKEEIKTLSLLYDKTIDKNSLLDAETRDDKIEHVIQWQEIFRVGLAEDKRLKRSIAAWAMVKHRIEMKIDQQHHRLRERSWGLSASIRTAADREQEQEMYRRLLDWATDEARHNLVTKDYQDNPESSNRQPVFLYKSTFSENVLKQIALRLIDNGVRRLSHHGKVREYIEVHHPGLTLSLKTTEELDPRIHKGILNLWNRNQENIMRMDLRGSAAGEFRRAVAYLARDIQMISGETRKLKLIYESLKAKGEEEDIETEQKSGT